MKFILLAVLGIAVIFTAAFLTANLIKDNWSQQFLGSAFDDRNFVTLLGSSTNLVSVPNTAVFANSTTTDAGGTVFDGGFTLQQLVNTGGIRKIKFYVQGIGGTATSTLHMKQMGSFDGTNFFELATTTDMTTGTITGTTSPGIIVRAFAFDPGVATSSFEFEMPVDGDRFTRFVFYGDNLSTDPLDGVQAWITASFVRDERN